MATIVTQDITLGSQVIATSTDTTSTHYINCAAYLITGSGTRAVDISGAGAVGSTTTPTFTLGSATTASPEVAIAAIWTPTNNPTITEASGWTQGGSPTGFGGSINIAVKDLAASGQTPTYNPGLSAADESELNIVTVK